MENSLSQHNSNNKPNLCSVQLVMKRFASVAPTVEDKRHKGNHSTTADEDLPEPEGGHLKNKNSIITFQKRTH